MLSQRGYQENRHLTRELISWSVLQAFGPAHDRPWAALTTQEREAAVAVGGTQGSWDASRGTAAGSRATAHLSPEPELQPKAGPKEATFVDRLLWSQLSVEMCDTEARQHPL